MTTALAPLLTFAVYSTGTVCTLAAGTTFDDRDLRLRCPELDTIAKVLTPAQRARLRHMLAWTEWSPFAQAPTLDLLRNAFALANIAVNSGTGNQGCVDAYGKAMTGLLDWIKSIERQDKAQRTSEPAAEEVLGE